MSLNPCFSGCWSRTLLRKVKAIADSVLILVLVDVGLGPFDESLRSCGCISVLILVLVDVGLGPVEKNSWRELRYVLILVLVDVGLGLLPEGNVDSVLGCLNPCFSGCWSRTRMKKQQHGRWSKVLILVLVDVGLGQCWRISGSFYS